METKPQIEFQQGKWYKTQVSNNFAKCLKYEDDVMYASELKITDYQKIGEYPFCEGYTWLEATQEELKEFLPEGHPDLIQNSSTMEKDISEAKFKIGEIVNTANKGWQYCIIEHINSMSYVKSAPLSNVTITEIRFSNMHQNFWYLLGGYGNWHSECALEPINPVKEPIKITNSIPNINSSKEELLEYVKKTYPTGTEIYSVHNDKTHSVDTYIVEEKDFKVFSDNSIDAGLGKAYLFYDNIWAKKVEVEEKVEIKQVKETITPKFKPGDKVEFISSTSSNAKYFNKGYTNLEIRDYIENMIPTYYVWERDKSNSWQVRENELQLMSSLETVIPQGGIDMLDIQRECKEKYPIGAIVKNTEGEEYKLIEDDTIYTIVGNYVYSNYLQGCLYEDGKWAELISLPKPEEDLISNQSQFKKGDYVVLLSGCNGGNTWTDYIPINHCYKLRQDYNLLNFRIELDIQGSETNGWYTINKAYPSKLEVRAATKEEIEHYEKIKKPYDVSILKSTKEPKSLVGRYLKALVDRPDGGSVKKNEIGIITDVYNDGNPLFVNFPSQKRYQTGKLTYEYGKYELIPEGFIPPTEEKIDFSSKETKQEEWIPKVGEYIIFDEVDILLVTEVLYDKYHDYWIRHTPKSFSGGGFGFKAYKHRIRKATSAEIPKEQVITNSSNPKFKIGDEVTVKDRKFDALGDGWRNSSLTYNKVDGVAYNAGTVEKIIPTEKGIYYRLSCHNSGDVKEEMLDLVSTATEIPKSKSKLEPEDFIVGGYIKLLRDYKGVPKGSVVMLTDITSDKRLAEFHSSYGDICSLWTSYYDFDAECEWVGMVNPEEMKGNSSIHEYPLSLEELNLFPYNLETETDLLIKPKKETENKKTRFDEQEFLSNPYNKEFKISKVKPEKKKVVLNFN